MLGHLCIVPLRNSSRGPALHLEVKATINTEIKEVDELSSLSQVYVIYVQAVVNISGTTIPFAQETTVLVLCVIFTVPLK
jgi:hypothetical protein